jgi:hypothetical protein
LGESLATLYANGKSYYLQGVLKYFSFVQWPLVDQDKDGRTTKVKVREV